MARMASEGYFPASLAIPLRLPGYAHDRAGTPPAWLAIFVDIAPLRLRLPQSAEGIRENNGKPANKPGGAHVCRRISSLR